MMCSLFSNTDESRSIPNINVNKKYHEQNSFMFFYIFFIKTWFMHHKIFYNIMNKTHLMYFDLNVPFVKLGICVKNQTHLQILWSEHRKDRELQNFKWTPNIDSLLTPSKFFVFPRVFHEQWKHNVNSISSTVFCYKTKEMFLSHVPKQAVKIFGVLYIHSRSCHFGRCIL